MSQKTTPSGNEPTFEITHISEQDSEKRENSIYVVQDESDATENKSKKQANTPDLKSENSQDYDDTPDISCGIGRLRTNLFGTRFANLYVFAICFALSNFFTSMVDQVIMIQITSLERQFNIDNARAGLFQTTSRIGFITTVLFAGHFAKKYHIPLIIGASGVLQGLVLTIPAIMQVVEPYELPLLTHSKHGNSSNSTGYGDNAKYMCVPQDSVANNNESTNVTEPEVKQVQFMVVLAVQVVKGVSDTFHSGVLPTLFMDDNLLDKSKMGIFLGIWMVISELSGPIGKQINGILTKVPIDLTDTEMGPKDKRFVSAWWLAFLVFGLGTAVFSLPIMLFPRKLISKRQKQEALAKAVLTFAGGEVEDEVEEIVPDKPAETAPVSTIVSNGQPDAPDLSCSTIVSNGQPDAPDLSCSTIVSNGQPDAPDLSASKGRHYSVRKMQSRNNSRKSSRRRRDSGESRFSGSRRSSLFPPVIGPTERKVSLAGDLVFDQPIKSGGGTENLKYMLKDFPKALLRVLRKPVFVLMLVDIAIISVPYSGTAIFRSAYMTNEYNVPMSEVALVSGVTTAVGHILGTVISSAISSRVKTKMGYMYIISSTYLLTLVIIPFYFVVGCSNEVVYGAEGEIGRPVNTSDCECDPKKQLISCGVDGKNYLSPCFAQCSDVNGTLFMACAGLNSTSLPTVTPGLCNTDCHTNFIIYAILHGAQNIFSSMAMLPKRLLILRIVDPQDRGFATSLFMFCFVLIGIPSPNLFGKVIDGACLIWDGKYCSLYDRDTIRYIMSGIDISVHGVIQVTFLFMMCIIKWENRRAKKQAKKEAASQSSGKHIELTEL